ncbi:alpha-amylase family glycosyl hydrolase [Kitasatospora sp. NPDC097691]|uniref:alpha-amylase family glycosyl hydrolase n=1 Tax=Kitasatospora sp. NPDC097691 TaxID=3157231 RepID=UPI003316C7E0
MSSRSKSPAFWLRTLTVVFTVAIFAMLVDVFVDSAIRHTQNVTAAIIGVFGALVLALLALASPGTLEELSFGPFKAKWQRIRKLEDEVQSLQLAMLSLLTRYERSHLRKLVPGNEDGQVQYRPSMYQELERLYHLGYVKPRPESPGLMGMKETFEKDPITHFALSEYVAITAKGTKYLDLYRTWTPKVEVSRQGDVTIGGKAYGRAENWEDVVDFAMRSGWIDEPDGEDVDFARNTPETLRTPEALRTPDAEPDRKKDEVPPGMGAIPEPDGTGFRVWAPHAGAVSVLGSFDGWATPHPMATEGDGCWAVRLEEAGPGDEYKYVVTTRDTELSQNTERWKIDPYARRLTGSVGNAVIEAATFDWGKEEWHPPDLDELVIYELHVGTFSGAHDGPPGRLSGLIERLDVLEDLGVTAIELMPVTEYAGERSWGYNPVSAFAVAGDYGTPDDLRTLVREAHAHGLAVLCDVVYNHFGPNDLDAGLRRFDGWYQNDGDGIYFYNDERRGTWWGPRPDYGRPEVRRYLKDSALCWLQEYHMDGLRWDGTAFIRSVGVSNEGADGPGDGIPDGWLLLREVNGAIGADLPGRIRIAEDLQDDDALTADLPDGAGFDSQWDGRFVHALRDALTAVRDEDRDMQRVCEAIGHRIGDRALARVVYTESHDDVAQEHHRRRLPEAIWPDNAGSRYAKKRSTLGAVAVMTAPGIPMIFQGQEYMEETAFDDRTRLDWAAKRQSREGITRLYRELITLRRNCGRTTAGLRGAEVETYHCNDIDKVIAFRRYPTNHPDDSTVVVLNFGNRAYEEYELGFPREGIWHVRFNSDAKDYDPEFENAPSPDVRARPGTRDGQPCMGTVGVGRYSAVILSQDP